MKREKKRFTHRPSVIHSPRARWRHTRGCAVDGCSQSHLQCRKQEILNGESEQKRRERTEPPLSRNSRSVERDEPSDQPPRPAASFPRGEGCKWGTTSPCTYIYLPTASLLNSSSRAYLSPQYVRAVFIGAARRHWLRTQLEWEHPCINEYLMKNTWQS